MAESLERHVVAVPFPFTSHGKSLLRLVTRLARHSPATHFTFLSTPTLSESSSSDYLLLPANVKPLPLGDGLSTAAISSGRDLAPPGLFLAALPGNLRTAVAASTAASGRTVTSLLVDGFLSVHAAEMGLPWVAVWSSSPFPLFAAVEAELLRAGSPGAAEFIPGVKGERVLENCPSKDAAGNTSFAEAMHGMGRALPRASAVVLSSYREIYPEELHVALESRLRTKLLNIGFHTVEIPIPTTEPTSLTHWLDGQKPNSVAYISFGTISDFSSEELTAVAEALEEKAESVPFVWSLPDFQKQLLPNGFVERTSRLGKVVAWANQIQVLAHGSVGVHVTHCGCNSVNESIATGVPIIARPFWADNGINAKIVESVWEIGVGLEGGVFTKEGFVNALEIVLEREEGTKMRERALALKKLVVECSGPNGSGTRDFDALLGLLIA